MERNIKNDIEKLVNIQKNHSFWENPLLRDIEEGMIKFEELQFIFSQYYFYTKNFTKLLAAALIKCDDDYHRAQLAKNLWEEGGALNIEERHIEIYRKFLKEGLSISIDNILYHNYTKAFLDECIRFCLSSTLIESIAFLSLGIEGIISRFYTILREGLIKCNIDYKYLEFFNLHIACDDEHAEILKEILFSHYEDALWFERCEQAMTYALDLRNDFFTELHHSIQSKRIQSVIKNIVNAPRENGPPQLEIGGTLKNINDITTLMYKNKEKNSNINFYVNEIQFPFEVLNPRILCIAPGFKNEYHKHAHESFFYIISGKGSVKLENHIINIKNGDFVHIPRWICHQTENTGTDELKILAITDYHLTRIFPGNSPCSYRKNITNIINI